MEKEQNKPKSIRVKEKIKTRVEIHQTENIEISEKKITENKSWFLKK